MTSSSSYRMLQIVLVVRVGRPIRGRRGAFDVFLVAVDRRWSFHGLLASAPRTESRRLVRTVQLRSADLGLGQHGLLASAPRTESRRLVRTLHLRFADPVALSSPSVSSSTRRGRVIGNLNDGTVLGTTPRASVSPNSRPRSPSSLLSKLLARLSFQTFTRKREHMYSLLDPHIGNARRKPQSGG